jgi:hypothetical protein
LIQVSMRVFFLYLALLAAPLRAVEGIPEWSRVLDGVLRRAEAEQVRAHVEQSPPAADPLHPAVLGFIRYYETAGAAAWSQSIRRLQEIRPTVEQVFREEGVPEELLWLGRVESGYRPSARSPKNAAGVWQFIPETAGRFGLVVSRRQDERFETSKATRAAARYLRFLYQTFGDWNLSLAAYNAGEARVQSAIDRTGSRDFWTLAALLPRETQAYVPAVLAAQIVGTAKTAAAAPAQTAHQSVQAPFSLTP